MHKPDSMEFLSFMRDYVSRVGVAAIVVNKTKLFNRMQLLFHCMQLFPPLYQIKEYHSYMISNILIKFHLFKNAKISSISFFPLYSSIVKVIVIYIYTIFKSLFHCNKRKNFHLRFIGILIYKKKKRYFIIIFLSVVHSEWNLS